MKTKAKYLIVGQGLAGTSIAYALWRKGASFIVVDPNHEQTSSKAAGGLFNPITGRVRKMTWKASLIFPYLHQWYRELETFLDTPFLYSKPLYYPFFNILEQNEWLQKSADAPYNSFIKSVSNENMYGDNWMGKYGGMTLKNTGYVDIKGLLEAFRKKLERENRLIHGTFDEDQWTWNGENWSNQNTEVERIVHCGGMQDKLLPLWNFVPLQPLKGEILKVKIDLPDELIINRGVFINRPVDDSGTVIVGSSYQRGETSLSITGEARDKMCEKLEKLYFSNYEIVDQWAGIRPTSRDRRPIMGEHPEVSERYIFNGLGTKGVSLAPYFANQFSSVLEEGKELDDEVNISRFYSLYWS